jgi:hypothetical protein
MQHAIEEAGAWLGRIRDPRRCDIIVLTGRSGSDAGVGRHVGIVESFTNGIVRSIEGNWGDKVARVARSIDDGSIAGFGRWPKENA